MSCERYADALIDHACGAEIAPEVRRHLEMCDVCRARFDQQLRAMHALDAELRDALAIAPSAHFDRAVRARIEGMSSATSATIWWAAAAAALIVIGLAAIRSTERAVVLPPEVVSRTAGSRPEAPTIVPPAPPTPRDRRDIVRASPERRGHRPPQRGGSSLPEVEVIVSADQSRAIERYMALVRSGTLDTSTLVTPTESGTEPPALVVAPLTLDPLTVPDVEIGAGPSVNAADRNE
jgi:hypothetical protein